jgi:hypothetical protein
MNASYFISELKRSLEKETAFMTASLTFKYLMKSIEQNLYVSYQIRIENIAESVYCGYLFRNKKIYMNYNSVTILKKGKLIFYVRILDYHRFKQLLL